MSNYLTENLRTVALVGHGSCGKTSLIEAMLYRTGMISELGSIERGNTMCDNDALEKQVQHSIRLAVAHVDTALPDLTPVRIHVLDTPGYPDYIGQDMSALDAVKSVCAVVDATKGVELLTRRMMDIAKERGLCRMIAINKFDAPDVDLEQLLKDLQEVWGPGVLPINLPANNRTIVIDCFDRDEGEADILSVGEVHQVLLLCDLQQCHAGAGVLFCGSTHLGSKALAGLMDLAQVGVQAHALHLQLLLDDLHLLLVGIFHQNTGDLALCGIGQLTKDHVLGMVQRTAVAAVEQLLLHEGAVLLHGLLAHLLGKVAVQGRQLTHAHVMQLDLEHSGLACQLLAVVVLGEGDVDLELVPCLVAQNAVLETGDHAAAAQLHGLILCGAALKGYAVQHRFLSRPVPILPRLQPEPSEQTNRRFQHA